MISVEGVSKTFGSGSGAVAVLDDVSLEVARGDFAVITGHSGAGKSTLLGIIGGLLRPSAGGVSLEGQPLADLDEKALASVRARKIGFVFQNAPVIRSLTVLENVLLPATFLDTPGGPPRARALQLLEAVGLGEMAERLPAQLSGGEKRRVAIASALMNGPALLLADEPTGDLDEDTERRVLAQFEDLNAAGMTVVMVTHNRDLRLCANRTFEMTRGTLRETGPVRAHSTHAGRRNPWSALLRGARSSGTS